LEAGRTKIVRFVYAFLMLTPARDAIAFAEKIKGIAESGSHILRNRVCGNRVNLWGNRGHINI